MPRRQRFLAARELVRTSWACGEREYDGVTRLTEACYAAQEVDLAPHFVVPALSTLARAIDEYGFAAATFPGGFERDRRARDEAAQANAAWLRSALSALSAERDRPVVLDHLGVASALYRDLGVAAPGRRRLGFLSQRPRAPHQLGSGFLAESSQEGSSEPVELARELERWVVPGAHAEVGDYLEPGPALQIVLLAVSAGVRPRDTAESVWHHLALAVGRYRKSVGLPEVLDLAAALGVRDRACQGVALVRHLFPELRGWAQLERAGVGSWHLQVPVRIFARRVVAATFP
ncbi:MAG TPA: hypothetical protein VMV46_03800 [Thermoanaerobaculia bacterium]|nr:hypothetical protein [Thermoanaerobaculia bacterium]